MTPSDHMMSPTSVFVLLVLAFVIDWMSIGPNSIRDRIAFFIALAAIREGFNGSDLDRWTVDKLSFFIDQAKHAAGDAYIAGAITDKVIGALIAVLAIYVTGCMLPAKAYKKIGAVARLKFPSSPIRRLNIPLWIAAILLGMLADLSHGLLGTYLNAAVTADVWVNSLLPGWLFGI